MKSRNSVYLVTGAAGFIGSNVCRTLLTQEQKSTIIGIDALTPYYDPEIKKRRIRELRAHGRFIFYKTSICNKKEVGSITAKHRPDILIHLAASVGVRNGETRPAEYFETNITGTLTILEAAADTISRAVIFSSSSVYGNTSHLPFCESDPVTLHTPLSVYGISKAAMEMAVRHFVIGKRIPTTMVRPFSIYGPDGRPDMLPMKILSAAVKKTPIEIYAAKTTWRDWTYIDDCVGMTLALLSKPEKYSVINIGNNRPIRLDSLVTVARAVIGKYGYSLRCIHKPANKTEIPRTQADITQIQKYFKRETMPFPHGFSRTADYFFSRSAR